MWILWETWWACPTSAVQWDWKMFHLVASWEPLLVPVPVVGGGDVSFADETVSGIFVNLVVLSNMITTLFSC